MATETLDTAPLEILQAFEIAPNREAWQKLRREFIGASESAAVLGFNPYSSPLTVWHAKREGGEIVPNLRMEIGRAMEPITAQAYEEETGRVVIDPGDFAILRHRERPFIGATLDRLVHDPDRGWGVLEVKWANVFAAAEWTGGDAPLMYRLQLNHQIDTIRSHIPGIAWGSLACITGGGEFRYLDAEYSPELAAEAAETYVRFWECVTTGRKPEIDGSESTRRTLEAIYYATPGTHVVANATETKIAAQKLQADLEAASSAAKEAADYLAVVKNRLREFVGEFGVEYVEVPGVGIFTFRECSRSAYSVSASVYREARILKGMPKAKKGKA